METKKITCWWHAYMQAREEMRVKMVLEGPKPLRPIITLSDASTLSEDDSNILLDTKNVIEIIYEGEFQTIDGKIGHVLYQVWDAIELMESMQRREKGIPVNEYDEILDNEVREQAHRILRLSKINFN